MPKNDGFWIMTTHKTQGLTREARNLGVLYALSMFVHYFGQIETICLMQPKLKLLAMASSFCGREPGRDTTRSAVGGWV